MKQNIKPAVIKAVETEVAYQNTMTERPDRPDMIKNMQMGAILHAMRVNLRKAEDACYTEAKHYENTMQFIRKIAGLSMKAGNQFGMPPRISFDMTYEEYYAMMNGDESLVELKELAKQHSVPIEVASDVTHREYLRLRRKCLQLKHTKV